MSAHWEDPRPGETMGKVVFDCSGGSEAPIRTTVILIIGLLYIVNVVLDVLILLRV